MEKNMLVFVYGTLMSGLRLSHILDSSEFLGEVIASEVCLYNLGPYPAIKLDDGAVMGELYYVNDKILQQLDMVEGFYPEDLTNSLYHRKKIKILLPTIDSDVVAYFYNGPIDSSRLIVSGDYRAHINSKVS